MTFKPERYPADWRYISWRIRHVRADDRCECVGNCGDDHPGTRCNAPNGELIHRLRRRPALWTRGQPDIVSGSLTWFPSILVVLTVAHLCQDSLCENESHLLALCQRCHLKYDAKQHASNAAETRRKKKAEAVDASGQEELL